jgi:hypothetical protein
MKVRSKRRNTAEMKAKKMSLIRKLNWIAEFSGTRNDTKINFIFNLYNYHKLFLDNILKIFFKNSKTP